MFAALSDLLDTEDWFFGLTGPSLFDASVFAYTHLILDSKMHWSDNKLEELLMEHGKPGPASVSDVRDVLLGDGISSIATA